MTASSSEPVLTAKPPKPVGRWEDFIDIFYAPAEVFRRRQNESVWPPLLIITALMFVVTFATANALSPMTDAIMTKAMVKAMHDNPQMTQEMADTMRTNGTKFGKFLVLLAPLYLLLLGLGVWVLGKLFGSRQTYYAAVVVVAYAAMATVLELLANGLQALVIDVSNLSSPYPLQIGPARFFSVTTTPTLLFAVLSASTVFAIWKVVLISVGWYATGGVSRRSAAIAGVIFWMLTVVLELRTVLTMR